MKKNSFMKKSHSNLSKNEPLYFCKEGWYVGLGWKGACVREGGGTVGERKEGKQAFKKERTIWVKRWVS